MKKVITFAGLMLGGIAAANAQPLSSQRYTNWPDVGTAVGDGWDSSRETPIGTPCIEFKVVQNPGAITQEKFGEVRDVSSVLDQVSASARAKASLFLSSIEGSVTYGHVRQLNDEHFNAMAEVSVLKRE